MAEGLAVDADLVGTAGMDTVLHEGVGAELFKDFIIGEGGLAFAIDHHLAGFCRMLHDGQVDAALFLGEGALGEALVDLFYFAIFEYSREIFVGGFIFGEEDDAAGVAVEAVDDEDVAVFFS